MVGNAVQVNFAKELTKKIKSDLSAFNKKNYMNKEELDAKFKQAQDAEGTGDFFIAAHHYKEALSAARDLNDSQSIVLCKKKVVEMNQKSEDSFKKFSVEQNISNEEVNKVVDPILEGSLEEVLRKIGKHPFLFPRIQQVEEKAKGSMPIAYQVASISTISENGHLVQGGADGSYSWMMKLYGIHQGLITELYLNRIFNGLASKGFSEESLLSYLRSRKIFPENNLKVISVGIERYFAEDYVSALHILIPQFESVFLFISEKRGIDVLALNRGEEISTQFKALSAKHLSSEAFQNEWGRDFCKQLKFVLFEPLGDMLRHKVAHGQIKKEECTLQKVNLILYFYLVLVARIGIKQ
jgi:hypothetical protein